MIINNGEKILFTGDSITDCGRDRNDICGLTAYSKIISGYISLFNPELNVTVYNRGISGDTTKMLDGRMEKDLGDTKPTAVSILIGINDVWRRYDSDRPTTLEDFKANVKSIIAKAKKYTDKIIILEPFVIPSDPAKAKFREDLDPKINALREIAKEEKLEYIPLDGIFAEKSITGDPKALSADGIHPLYGGYRVIAAEWIKRTNLYKTGI